MRAAAVVAHAAVLDGVRTSLTAVLLVFGNGAGAFRVCTLILDCFGHRISPVRYLFTVLRCKGLARGKEKPAFRSSETKSLRQRQTGLERMRHDRVLSFV